MKKLLIYSFVLGSIGTIGCSHVPGKGLNNAIADATSKNSSANERSHNAGKACMSCHRAGGGEAAGEGKWTLAGTVYNEATMKTLPGSTVDFYTGPNATGAKLLSLEVDRSGNLYTTRKINFGNGIYPVVTSPNGNKAFMSSSISQGDCNSCHDNNNTPRITVQN
jgi:hypothetical protein